MENKNPKSESYIVKEAEHIIDEYLKKREMLDIKRYFDLKIKYIKVKKISIVLLIINCVFIIFNTLIR